MGLKCVLCGCSHLPTERCGRDTEGGLGRGAISAPVSVARAGVEGRVMAVPTGRFDRAAYQRAYMRGWRARKKGAE
jgi:hypothetical protein